MLGKQYHTSLITLSVHLAEGQAVQMFVVFPFNQLMRSTTKRPNVRLFAFLCLSNPSSLCPTLVFVWSILHWAPKACMLPMASTLPMSLTGLRLLRLRASKQASFDITEKKASFMSAGKKTEVWSIPTSSKASSNQTTLLLHPQG